MNFTPYRLIKIIITNYGPEGDRIILIIFVTMLASIELRPIVFLSTLFIMYYTLIHALWTSSPQHFIYYRTSIEYILFFAAFLPIGYYYRWLKPYLNQLSNDDSKSHKVEFKWREKDLKFNSWERFSYN